NFGELSSLFDFEEIISNPHNNQGPPLAGPPPQNNNGPPPVVRPNGPAPDLRSMEELHIDKFLEVTQHMKKNGVSDDALRLSLFPYSLTHHATAWNEITNFRQDPNESLFEALERYKLSIDQCPNHNTLLVTQIDMFYNGLTLRHLNTINATLVKSVNLKCKTCGGPYSFTECPAINGYIQEADYAITGNHNSWGNSYQPQVDYDVNPRVPLILGRPFLRTARALIDVHELVNQINVIDVACEEYAQEVLGFFDSLTSGNPTPSDPIIATSSPLFTPFEGSDFILEEIETFLRTLDELSNLDDDYYDTEGDILYLEKLLNEDPSTNLPLMMNEDLKQVDVTITKPSIEEPP
nr:reverse transcriptase domain-containing protein [Tanacetum cinerariifolium]